MTVLVSIAKIVGILLILIAIIKLSSSKPKDVMFRKNFVKKIKDCCRRFVK